MRGKSVVVITACLVVITVALPLRSSSEDSQSAPAYREGEVLVRFRPGSDELDRSRAKDLVHALHVRKARHLKTEKLSLGPGVTSMEAVRLLRADPGVEYAELNWRVTYLAAPRVQPDDPYYTSGDQWYLDAQPLPGHHVTLGRPVNIDRDIDAPEAWAVMSAALGSGMSGAVGVIDSGCGESGYFDSLTGYVPDHLDLPARSLWANTVELANLGMDDADANDYVDDVNGWDFIDKDNAAADVYDESAPYHGTLISGIIAAAWDNGEGGAGIGMDSLKVLPLRTIYVSEILDSIDYAIDTTSGTPSIKVLNASWTVGLPLQSLQDAIEAAGAAGIAFVAAAGNAGNNNDTNKGDSQVYPAEYTKVPLDNILAVAAADVSGGLAWFSNYGPDSVQVAAPGTNIFSVYGGSDQYNIVNGTSFSTPIAASVLALVMSANPVLTPAQAIDRLIEGGDFDSRLAGLIESGKRVNMAGALAPFHPYSGLAYIDSPVPISFYADSISQMYGSIAAVSLDPSYSTDPPPADLVSGMSGGWAVSPIQPGIAQFALTFDGVSAPTATVDTGPWRITAIRPFTGRLQYGEEMLFESLLPGDVSWSVTDSTVAVIGDDGRLRGLKKGTTQVILTVDGVKRDSSGQILVLSNPPSRGGGCGTTVPPGDNPEMDSALIIVTGLILLALRRRWPAEASPGFKVKDEDRLTQSPWKRS